MYLTVAWRLLRWQLQSGCWFWGNLWALCWWCPARGKSVFDTHGHRREHFFILRAKTRKEKSTHHWPPCCDSGLFGEQRLQMRAKHAHSLQLVFHYHLRTLQSYLTGVPTSSKPTGINKIQMFSDLQFHQEHLVIFCLNLLFMYNLLTGRINKSFH